MSSTLTLQSVVNLASTQLELLPLAGVGGYSYEPALSLCIDVLQTLLAQPLDFKFNRAEMNMFVTCPNRQDYLFAGATFFSLGGNACGAGIDLTSNNALTISGSTVTIKLLESYNGAVNDACYILGSSVASYNSTFTQNGTNSAGFSGCTYTITAISADLKTITATVSGGSPSGTGGSAGITDFGWAVGCTILGIQNGGPILPTRHVQAVRDIQPYGYANIPESVCVYDTATAGVMKIRFYPVVGTTIWGANLVYQKKAPLPTSLAGTWAPFPDELSYVYRQGFLAKGYRYVNSPRADVEEQKFQAAIGKALGADQREVSDVSLYPAEGIQTSTNNFWLL